MYITIILLLLFNLYNHIYLKRGDRRDTIYLINRFRYSFLQKWCVFRKNMTNDMR